jgi:hypothetical protein
MALVNPIKSLRLVNKAQARKTKQKTPMTTLYRTKVWGRAIKLGNKECSSRENTIEYQKIPPVT